jgi:hypothetical protein
MGDLSMPKSSVDVSPDRGADDRHDRGPRLPLPPSLRVLIGLTIAVLVIWLADVALSVRPAAAIALLITAGLAAIAGTVALTTVKRQRR